MKNRKKMYIIIGVVVAVVLATAGIVYAVLQGRDNEAGNTSDTAQIVDPNRHIGVIGVTDAEFDPDLLDVSFNGVMVCRGGQIGDDRGLVDLAGRQVHVLVDLHAGGEAATILTNDLTYDYVRENAEYST